MTPDKTPTPKELEDLARKHGATSYRNRADTRHPAYGFTEDGLRNLLADALAKWGSPVVAVEPTVKYVPVKADLRDKHWNHPRDDEPRTEACRKALRDRGDDEGQGLDGYWKWGFAAGFNAALAATPQPTQAQE